jgi:hypothetical protein
MHPTNSSPYTHSTPPKVLLLALDGLGRSPIDYPTYAPFLSSLLPNSINFPDAVALFPTDSAPNWGSVLHGVLPEKHGLTNGDVERGKEFDENSPYPSVFKILVRRAAKEKDVNNVNRSIPDDNVYVNNNNKTITEKASTKKSKKRKIQSITKRFICTTNNSVYSEHLTCNEPIKYASFAAWSPINSGIIERSIPGVFYSPKNEPLCTRIRLHFKHYILKSPSCDPFVLTRVLS